MIYISKEIIPNYVFQYDLHYIIHNSSLDYGLVCCEITVFILSTLNCYISIDVVSIVSYLICVAMTFF